MKKVPAKMLPAVHKLLNESLQGWADSLSVNVENVSVNYRGKIVVENRRASKEMGPNGTLVAAKNTMTLAQLQKEIVKVDAKAAKANAKQAEQTEQARRAELYADRFQKIGVVSYEPDIDALYMRQLEFVAMLVNDNGFDPEFFTDDE